MATSDNKGSEFIKGNPYTCFTHPARHEGLQAVFGAPSQFVAGFGGELDVLVWSLTHSLGCLGWLGPP